MITPNVFCPIICLTSQPLRSERVVSNINNKSLALRAMPQPADLGRSLHLHRRNESYSEKTKIFLNVNEHLQTNKINSPLPFCSLNYKTDSVRIDTCKLFKSHLYLCAKFSPVVELDADLLHHPIEGYVLHHSVVQVSLRVPLSDETM